MKYFYLPCALLLALFAASLLNAKAAGSYVSRWCSDLSEIQQCAQREEWDEARESLSGIYESWDESKAYFHIITVHEELDEAEALFAKTRSFAIEEDEAEFRASAAELISQLQLLSEMQEISIKNIL